MDAIPAVVIIWVSQTFLACRRSRRDLGIREQLGVEKMDGF